MAKSAQAFRTIREVADWLGVAAHVLRFWESKFSQIKPVKRAGGRRYYRPSDMQLVGGIKVLLHDRGMTIRGVKKMISDEGLEAITSLSPPIDSLLEDADVIDITPDKEWEADAVAETQGSGDAAADKDVPPQPPVEETSEAEVETAPAEEEAETPDTTASSAPEEESDEVSTTPDEPDVIEDAGPAHGDVAHAPFPPQPAAPLGAPMAQLAQFARSADTLAPHLPALKALRDRMDHTRPSG